MSGTSRRAASKIGRATAAKINRVPPDHDDYLNACALIVDTAIARAVERERERCVRIADAWAMTAATQALEGAPVSGSFVANEILAALRATAQVDTSKMDDADYGIHMGR